MISFIVSGIELLAKCSLLKGFWCFLGQIINPLIPRVPPAWEQSRTQMTIPVLLRNTSFVPEALSFFTVTSLADLLSAD